MTRVLERGPEGLLGPRYELLREAESALEERE
jgi:hypothetical protein